MQDDEPMGMERSAKFCTASILAKNIPGFEDSCLFEESN